MIRHLSRRRQSLSIVVASVTAAVAVAVWLAPEVSAQGGAAPQRGGAPPAAQNPRTIAPIDLTGNWVPIITEDWRWRMLTPPKGDFASLPLNAEGRRVADTWDLAKDEATGNACKPYGVGSIMRQPGRMRVSWQDDTTLKLEFDAGTQTRLLRFTGQAPTSGERTWQGYSVATWEVAGQQINVDRNGIPIAGPGPAGGGGRGGRGGRGAAAPPRGGSLKVVTTYMRDGYLRKNGVPYSGSAVITEYFDRLGPEPNGDVLLNVRTVVDDPKYLQQIFITSTNFKLEPDGSKWNPTPCKTDPPVQLGAQ